MPVAVKAPAEPRIAENLPGLTASELAKLAGIEDAIDKAADGQDAIALVRLMSDTKARARRVEVLKTALERLVDRIRFSKLPDLMDLLDLQNFRVEDVGLCYLQDDVHVQVKDMDGLKKWFVEHELEDAITESVNGSTLAAYVRQMMKDKKKPKIPNSLIQVKPYTRAVITK